MARILVVDDDPLMSATFERQLGDAHDVLLTDDAQKALALAERGVFDLFLLDYGLRGRTGVELCAQLRQAGLREPVLITSGRADARRLQAARDAGASGWLPKPSPPQEILGAVASLLAHRPARRRTSQYV
jgi:DNA-binding response OmpR family regulator